MNVVLCCRCGDYERFVNSALHLLKIDAPLLTICAGPDEIREFAANINDGNMKERAIALSKNKEKFYHYFEYDANGKMIVQYNLKTGTKVC